MNAHPSEAENFSTVLQQELEQIAKRRAAAELGKAGAANAEPLGDEAVRQKALEEGLVGLSFSGGGIRSATFNLGILQALADFGLLKYFDYLSTVSGGGYIGSWLAAWIKRDGSLDNVEKQLKPTRADQANATRTELIVTSDGIKEQKVKEGEPREAEPEPIAHLRAYSNYLSPRLGIFSADVWVLGAIYLRNLLLNQAAILPAILFIMLVVRWIFWAFLREDQAPWKEHAVAAMALTVACSLLALGWIIYSLWRLWQVERLAETKSVRLQLGSGMLHLFVLLPLLFASGFTCRIFVSKGVSFWEAFFELLNTAPLTEEIILGSILGAFPVAVLILQIAAFARFLWFDNVWHWKKTACSLMGAAVWLIASLLIELVSLIIASAPTFLSELLLRRWKDDVILRTMALIPAVGLFCAGVNVMGYLFYHLITANAGRKNGAAPAVLQPSHPRRLVELWTDWGWGSFLRYYLVALLTGMGAVVLSLALNALRMALQPWWKDHPDRQLAVGYALIVGMLHGSAHLYYVFFRYVNFCGEWWRKIPDDTKGFWICLWKCLGLEGNVRYLLEGALFGFGIGTLLLITLFDLVAVHQSLESFAVAAVAFFGPPTAIASIICYVRNHGFREMPWWVFAGVIAGMLGGALLFAVGHALEAHSGNAMSLPVFAASTFGLMGSPLDGSYSTIHSAIYNWPPSPFAVALIVVFGPPAILGIIMVMIALEIGLLSRYLPESAREWLASLGGWLMIYATGYIIIFGVVMFGGWLLVEAGPYMQAALGAGWLTAAISGVLAGHSPRTGHANGPSRLDLIAKVAPFVFLAGLLFLVSLLVSALVDNPPTQAEMKARVGRTDNPTEPPVKVTQVTKKVGDKRSAEETRTEEHVEGFDVRSIERVRFWEGMGRASPWTIGGWMAVCFIMMWIMAWRVDVNIFSLGALYRNRLVRCYLGASRAKANTPDNPVLGAPIHSMDTDPLRQPNPITGMDVMDDFALRELAIALPKGPRQNPILPAPGGSLAKDTAYFYVITAVTVAGETEWSNERGVVPTGGPAPQQTANLSWGPFVGAKKYRIYRSQQRGVYASPALVIEMSASTTSYTDNGSTELKPFRRYIGPYLLINAALNRVARDNLAWQERKAESFVFSPLYCGSMSTGFQPLLHDDLACPSGQNIQDRRDKLTLGKAITVSGAAVSPNMGYHSSPAVTALMTVFNARLGNWMRNPAEVGLSCWVWKHLPFWNWDLLKWWRQWHWTPHAPQTGLLYLAAEMFGFTGARASYVYLSDGGHFENLGVYELVRRRCRFIVATDAGADPGYEFEDLAGMIRKCRIDFGIRIELDVTRLRPEGEHKHCHWHCAIGLIRYDDVDPSAAPGILVYLKASLTGFEPSDVANYAAAHPDFPHQTTLDQFFNESQFESYRALGQHIAQKVFSDAVRAARLKQDEAAPPKQKEERIKANRLFVRNLFTALHKRWFPPPPEQEKEFLESVKGFVEAQQALRGDANLRPLAESLYPESKQPRPVPAPPWSFPDLHMVAQLLQAMENAWIGIRLEGFAAHPMNRGWLSVFRRWSSSSSFQQYWPFLRGEFGQDFVRFCEQQLVLKTEKAEAVPIDPRDWEPTVRSLFADLAQEWRDVPRLRDMAAELPTTGLGRRLWKSEVIRALEAAEQAFAPQADAAALLRNWVRRSINAVKKMSANGITGTELAFALSRCREKLDRSWRESIQGLVALQASLTRAQDQDIVEVNAIQQEIAAFTSKFQASWPGTTLRLGSLGLLPLTLSAATWYVPALEFRKRVVDWRTALDDSWTSALQPWKKVIEIALKHEKNFVPADDLAQIQREFRAFRTSFATDWTNAYDALGGLTAGLKRLLAGKEFPLPADRVGAMLSRLQRSMARALPAGLPADLPLRFIQQVEKALGLEPLVWLIPVPRQKTAPEKWSEDEYACGLICVLSESNARSELLVWIRGPYRNLGIGRECFDRVHSPLDQVCAKLKSTVLRDGLGNVLSADDVTLIARYPNGALPGSSDKLERAMWLSFFFDYEFRRQKSADAKAEADLILERRETTK